MRFKKLKISVGIALVVFILVVGYISAFGLFTSSKNTAGQSSIMVTPVSSKNDISPSNQNAQVQQVQTVQAQASQDTASQQVPVSIVQAFTTRAS